MSKELEMAKQELIKISQQPLETAANMLIKVVGNPYDPELPVAKFMEAIFTTDTVEIGEEYRYFMVDQDAKVVFTLVNGTVTQTNVSVISDLNLTFSDYMTPELYVYLQDLRKGKYDIVAKKKLALMESIDRLEQYLALQTVNAAVPVANVFGLSSGTTSFTYVDAVKMIRKIAQFSAGKFALITGSNITADIILLNYEANKFLPVHLEDLGIIHFPVEAQQVNLDGSLVNVIDPNTCYLVALSDSQNNRMGDFVRRKTSTYENGDAQERSVIAAGTLINVGTSRKYAISLAVFEEFGLVVKNPDVLCKYVRA